MKVLVPVFGAIMTASYRQLIAGLILAGVVYWNYKKSQSLPAAKRRGRKPKNPIENESPSDGSFLGEFDLKNNLVHYFVIGVMGSAVPFLLFAYAADKIPSSFSAVLNATSPIFGLLISAIVLGTKINARNIMGMGIAFSGVFLITGFNAEIHFMDILGSVLACLGASFGYAATAVYVKKRAANIDPMKQASASQVLGGLFLSILMPWADVPGPITGIAVAVLFLFSINSNAIAFLIYFRFLAASTATRAGLVTFLIPVFGTIYGVLLLSEVLTWNYVVGSALILTGTAVLVYFGKEAAQVEVQPTKLPQRKKKTRLASAANGSTTITVTNGANVQVSTRNATSKPTVTVNVQSDPPPLLQ